MISTLVRIGAVLTLLLGGMAVAQPKESRVALVVGNAAYRHAEPLRNPVRDAEAMAVALELFGFEVVKVANADRGAMTRGLLEFGRKLKPDGVALFFYAGHGVQIAGINYLIPIEAEIAEEAAVGMLGVDVQHVLRAMESGGGRLNMLLLDACRDAPFGLAPRNTGFTPIEAPRNTLIAYATAPGKTAADGEGSNGLFTAELLKAMAKPGLSVDEVLKRTGAGVEQASGNKQVPWINSSFRGRFSFVEASKTAKPQTSDAEILFWSSVKDSPDPAELDAYLAQYPKGQFAGLAKLRLDRLKAKPAQATAVVPPRSPASSPAGAFRDCPDCPEMVPIAAGRFTMGVPAGEDEREALPNEFRGRGAPQHPVDLRGFALGRFEVNRAQFASFVGESGHKTAPGCKTNVRGDWADGPELSWRDPGFIQNDRHPVVCVDFADATAYAAWLARKTGKPYRLPTEAEWEYAARAGSTAARPWGDAAQESCVHANGADITRADARSIRRDATLVALCADNFIWTAPVGSLRANRLGLHDMLGNVWEWTQDCWAASYAGAPADGKARIDGDCGRRVLRGGSFVNSPNRLRAGFRGQNVMATRSIDVGFRVARE